MSEALYGERSLLTLLVALSRVNTTLTRTGSSLSDALELAGLSGDHGIRRLLLVSARAMRGDLSGALAELEGDEAVQVLEAAARLEDAVAQAGAEAAQRLARAAAWAASMGLEIDAALLYAEAIRTRFQWFLIRPIDRLSALRLAAEIWPQEQEALSVLSRMSREELCYPRRYCPFRVPRSSEETRDFYSAAESAWRIASSLDLPPREAVLDRFLSKVEAPSLARVARRVLGDIPGLHVILRHEDIEQATGIVAVYDNTLPGLREAVERLPLLVVPAFRWRGASVEGAWLDSYGARLAAAVRDEVVAAPFYAAVEGAVALSRFMPGAMTRIEVADEGLLLEAPALGLSARLDKEGVQRFRSLAEKRVAKARDVEGLWRALAAAVLDAMLSS